MLYLKKYWYIGLIILIIVIVLIIFKPSDAEPEIVSDLILEVEESVLEESIVETIQIDIKGAVKNPGVYEMKTNSRVNDAIAISGGLTDDADTSVNNLSKNLTDEMVIIIYTKEEVAEMLKGDTSVKYIEKECVCPKLENDACIDNVIDNKPDNSNDTTDQKVSLNTATVEELMQLPGIGEVKAQAIITYREENGGFKTIEGSKWYWRSYF